MKPKQLSLFTTVILSLHFLSCSPDGGNLSPLDNGGFNAFPVTNFIAISPEFPMDGTVFVGTDVAGVFRSTDGGNTWVPADAGLPVDSSGAVAGVISLAISPAFPTDGTVFVGTDVAGVFRSTDGGNTWVPADAGLPVDSSGAFPGVISLAISPAFTTDGALFMGTDAAGVFRSVNGGNTWVPADAGLPVDSSGAFPGVISLAISPAFTTDGALFMGTDAAGVFRSVNGGNTWVPADAGLPVDSSGAFPGVISLAISPAFTTVGALFMGTDAAGVFRSVNGGNTWVPADAGLPVDSSGAFPGVILAISPAFATDGALFMGTDVAGVFRSVNGGNTWVPVDVGPFFSQ